MHSSPVTLNHLPTGARVDPHELYLILYVSKDVKGLVMDDVVADIVLLVEDLHSETFK